MRGRRHVDMGGICCGMCVEGVPCYGKDDALIDNDGNQGENKKQSKWCVDDSATERVFIPDGETPRLPPCVMSCRAVWLFASREVSRTSSARKGERGSERKKSSTPTRTAISLWVRFSLRSLKKTWGGSGEDMYKDSLLEANCMQADGARPFSPCRLGENFVSCPVANVLSPREGEFRKAYSQVHLQMHVGSFLHVLSAALVCVPEIWYLWLHVLWREE